MSTATTAARALVRGRDRATSLLTVIAFALPHAVMLSVIGGAHAFFQRNGNPTNPAMENGFYIFLACFASVLLIVPTMSMGAAASRLGLSRRSQDLAVMRLIGLPPRQTKLASVLDTDAHALVGIVLGSVLYTACLPAWQFLSFQDTPMSAHEMWVGPWILLGVGVAMIVLATASGWMALRRVAITPLGVARKSDAHGVSPIGTILAVIILLTWLVGAKRLFGMGTAIAGSFTLGFVAIIFALTNLVGIWIVSVVGKLMHKLACTPSTLLAARRVIDDPRALWRSFGSVCLVGFIVGVLYPFFSMIGSAQWEDLPAEEANLLADIQVGMLLTLGITFVLAAISTAINQAIRILDSRTELHSLNLMGASTSFMNTSRRRETVVPAAILIGGSMLLGLLFAAPIYLAGSPLQTLGVIIGYAACGIALIAGASEATRSLQKRVLR